MRKRKDNIVVSILGLFFEPIRKNSAFFIFMFLLGIICTYATVPNQPGAHAYSLAWPELFIDLYLICVVLAILPKTVRKWVKRLFYVIAYGVALADVFIDLADIRIDGLALEGIVQFVLQIARELRDRHPGVIVKSIDLLKEILVDV